MSLTETLISRVDGLHRKAHFFVASVALLGTMLLGSSLVAWQSSHEQQDMIVAYAQTSKILRMSAAVKIATRDALRGERGFLLTGDVTYLAPYLAGRDNLAQSLDDLSIAARGKVESADAVRDLRISVTAYLAKIGNAVALARSGEREHAIEVIRHGTMDEGLATIDKHVDGIIERERLHMSSIRAHSTEVTTTMLRFIYLMSAAGLCLLVLAVMSAVALRRSFARERDHRDELQKHANTDELTGVANRRQLLSVLDKRIAEARLNGTPLSFAMFDLDNFKRVNDTYGHAVGDRAIRHVVRTALRMVRVNDLVGRLGGEEFGIILPKADETNAFTVCDRLRKRLRDEGMPLDEQQKLWLTISSGIACLTDEDDAASLIERADKALYIAKRDGRDQVRLAA